jgi:hypothetical protein
MVSSITGHLLLTQTRHKKDPGAFDALKLQTVETNAPKSVVRTKYLGFLQFWGISLLPQNRPKADPGASNGPKLATVETNAPNGLVWNPYSWFPQFRTISLLP